jgi:hypothetical protein
LLSRGKIIISLLKLLFIISFFNINLYSLVFAESQQIIDYNYDGAGNIVSVRSGQNLGPPDVTNLSPPFVNKESFAVVTATGVYLANATVSINTLGVALLDSTNVSETEIKFTLFADNTAQIGLMPITFTTRLGTDIENIVVAERTPIVSTDPNPIILLPNGQGIDVLLAFDQPFATDQIFDVAITDESIASISAQTITLLAGETEVSTTVTGIVVGSTTLEVNQLSNFLALGIPVIVTNDQLPVGNYAFHAKPVAVSAYIPTPLNTTGIFTSQRPLGVAAYIEGSFQATGIFATQRPLGVAAYLEPSLNTTGLFATQRPLGVAAYIEPSLNTTGIFATQTPLGTAYGTIISQVTPATVTRGTSATLTLDGFELDAVTAVSFNPGDGITQTAAFTVTPDGFQMTIPISVTSGASIGARAIVLTTPAGDQLYSQGIFNIQ